eukprot:TRINITY_DN12926_c0_g2_i1.p1 TRINITY_DN12926_c0_g2~~TRINITY_DN12926_c0_g2_i1.p1  ORF type:complete len:620 (+),score=231.22 TRINITY_DN12926_c0_g2_i1:70-1929(+)
MRAGLIALCLAGVPLAAAERRMLKVQHQGQLAGHQMTGCWVRDGEDVHEYVFEEEAEDVRQRRAATAQEVFGQDEDMTRNTKQQTLNFFLLATSFSWMQGATDAAGWKAGTSKVVNERIIQSYIGVNGGAYGTAADVDAYLTAMTRAMAQIAAEVTVEAGLGRQDVSNTSAFYKEGVFSNADHPATSAFNKVVAWSWRNLKNKDHVLVYRGATTDADYVYVGMMGDYQAMYKGEDTMRAHMGMLGLDQEDIKYFMTPHTDATKETRKAWVKENKDATYAAALAAGIPTAGGLMPTAVRISEAFVKHNEDNGLQSFFTGFSMGGLHASAASMYHKKRFGRAVKTVTFGQFPAGCHHHQHMGLHEVFRHIDSTIKHEQIRGYIIPMDVAALVGEDVGTTCLLGTVKGGLEKKAVLEYMNATCGNFFRLPDRVTQYVVGAQRLVMQSVRNKLTPLKGLPFFTDEMAFLLHYIETVIPAMAKEPGVAELTAVGGFQNCLSSYHGSAAIFAAYYQHLLRELHDDGATKSGCIDREVIEYNGGRCANRYPQWFSPPSNDDDSNAVLITGVVMAGISLFLLFGVCAYNCRYEVNEDIQAPDMTLEKDKLAAAASPESPAGGDPVVL